MQTTGGPQPITILHQVILAIVRHAHSSVAIVARLPVAHLADHTTSAHLVSCAKAQNAVSDSTLLLVMLLWFATAARLIAALSAVSISADHTLATARPAQTYIII